MKVIEKEELINIFIVGFLGIDEGYDFVVLCCKVVLY